MSEQPNSAADAAVSSGTSSRQNQINVGLLVLGIVCATAGMYRLWQYKADYLPKSLWFLACGLTALVCGGLGFITSSAVTQTGSEKQRLRVLTGITAGGLLGAWTALLGFTLPFTDYLGTFTGGLKEWRENPAALLWTGGALFGG